jgi:hypothetical protein
MAKKEFNWHKPVELDRVGERKELTSPGNFPSLKDPFGTQGFQLPAPPLRQMGRSKLSNNHEMTRKALKKTFRQSTNTRRSSETKNF